MMSNDESDGGRVLIHPTGKTIPAPTSKSAVSELCQPKGRRHINLAFITEACVSAVLVTLTGAVIVAIGAGLAWAIEHM